MEKYWSMGNKYLWKGWMTIIFFIVSDRMSNSKAQPLILCTICLLSHKRWWVKNILTKCQTVLLGKLISQNCTVKEKWKRCWKQVYFRGYGNCLEKDHKYLTEVLQNEWREKDFCCIICRYIWRDGGKKIKSDFRCCLQW